MSILIRNTDKKITDVLELLAQGHTIDQICSMLELTPADIMLSASIACDLITKTVELRSTPVSGKVEFVVKEGRFQSLEQVRKKYPRAYEPWGKDEDKDLMELYQRGKTIKQIAEQLQRTTGSIKARIERLLPPKIEK